MSAKAKTLANYLLDNGYVGEDLRLRVVNSLITYGNEQLEEAAKLHIRAAMAASGKAVYSRYGPANSYAGVESVNLNWADCIRALKEPYLADLAPPKTFRDRLRHRRVIPAARTTQ